jgi:aspartate racemase
MKTIGLIGGLSWESSAEYYRIINQLVREKLGGAHSAKSIMYSVDFAEVEKLQHQEDWAKLTDLMIDAGLRLKNGGADFIVICTNTMHKMADEVESKAGIPVLHIADAAAAEVKKQGLKKVALLGTKFTMEQDFYKGRLNEKHGIKVLIPDSAQREFIHSVIYHELVIGKILDTSRAAFLKTIEHLHSLGAEGIVLGCTEIPLLIKQSHCRVPIFDTTQIHAAAAVKLALMTN